jgi:2-polyprenyl-3-methyl-5-hydroxy-6-metoxy-1,4-benzoquinol methylase
MTTYQPPDPAKLEAFSSRTFQDLSAVYTVAMCILGDRLGLFQALASHVPATSIELAALTRLNERYLREWLSALACADYLNYDAASGRFALSPEQAAVLAEEGGAVFLGGEYEQLPALWGVLDALALAFREGGGVPQSAYHERLYHGQDRNASVTYRHLLLQQWLPAMPNVQALLARGVEVADVGCGGGHALIALAQAYPNSRYTGYDVFPPTIALAQQNAQAAGVAERVRFVALDASAGLPAQYDLITTFIVVHDAAQPRALLGAIRRALRPGGLYLCSEIKASDRLEENAGPLGAYQYSTSVLYCMTTSLAEGGVGLGTAGLPPAKVRELALEAGFASVRQIPTESFFRYFYEISV